MSACNELAAGASLGAGPALRAVDCLANEAAGSAFGRLFGTTVGGGGGALLPALTILLTLYIAFFAFALITGRSRLGISALTPRMMTLGLVLTFATSWLAWQQVVWNLAIGAPDQLASLLIGAKGSATQLFADRIDLVSAAVASAADQPAGGEAGQAAQAVRAASTFSPEGLMWLGAMLLLLGTVGVLATARIALAVLLAIGPLFVVLGLFRGTRGLTAGWLRGVVMTAVMPLFVVVAGSIMFELVVPVVTELRGDNGIDARAAMALFLIAAVHCALMAMVMKVAGTIVSAWTVFGLAGGGRREDGQAQTAGPGSAVPALTAGSAPGTAVAATLPRTAALVPAAAMAAPRSPGDAAADAGAAARGRSVRRTVVAAAPASTSPAVSTLPRSRAQGIGSRFAARPASPRKMMR